MIRLVLFLYTIILFPFCGDKATIPIQVAIWDKCTLTFEGPGTSELDSINPFLDYRLEVTFIHSNHTFTVPGFYAADGNAAESSASSGNIWKVHFRPDLEGSWEYSVSFRTGKDIAVSTDPMAGEPISPDGTTGSIQVLPGKTNQDGRLTYIGLRYQQYKGSGKYFLKGGADSPENFLGYIDFDGTYKQSINDDRKGEAQNTEDLHKYEAHQKHWKDGDPTWKNGKGKGIIGALNYLSGKGMNVVYFLTMNIDGDGKDVFPYTSYEERMRFDCSKLDQWEIIFDHMDHLGIMLHVVTQETENELLLDGGDLGIERKLYYRELIARYAHHLGVTWNMGEENGPAHWTPLGQTIEQREQMISYFNDNDPYQNLVVIHSHSDRENRDKLFEPHLGNRNLQGMSMQVSTKTNIHEVTKRWIEASTNAGQSWVMNMDEMGKHWRGVDPDDRLDNNQDSVRIEALWGNLMAGGAGVEWYFGYKNHNNDLNCEDWTTRDHMWDYTRFALEFFQNHLPYWEMVSNDELVSCSENAFGFSNKGKIHVVYFKSFLPCEIDLSNESGQYRLKWYDPRNGGDLKDGSVLKVESGSWVNTGKPKIDDGLDWALLLLKED